MKKFTFSLFIAALLAGSATAQSWTVIPSASAVSFRSCSFGSASTAYTVGNFGVDSSTIEKTTNAGISFFHLSTSFLPAGAMLQSTCFTSADTGYIAGGLYSASATPAFGNGFIYRTTNGGVTWTAVVTGAATIFQNMCFPSPNVGYAIGAYLGSGSIVYKTADGGVTWTCIYTTPTNITMNRVDMTDDNNGHISGMDATTHQAVLANISGGVVSGLSNFAAYNYFGAIHFTSSSTGFVTAGSGAGTSSPAFYILKTTDGGTSWTSAYTSVYDYASCLKFDGSNAFAIGGNGLISADGGSTWTSMPTVATGFGSLSDMDIRNGVRLIVGESGLIARQAVTTAVPQQSVIDPAFRLYPNPASSVTNITFSELQSNTVVTITDLNGRVVKQITVNGLHAAIATNDIPKGLYVVSISGHESGFTKLSIE